MGRKISHFVIECVHQGAHSFRCPLVPLYGYPILGFLESILISRYLENDLVRVLMDCEFSVRFSITLFVICLIIMRGAPFHLFKPLQVVENPLLIWH